MDAKITVTTRCNARCKTCPVWAKEEQDMGTEMFSHLMAKLVGEDRITRILINNTGDLYNHPERDTIIKIMERANNWKPVVMTTNAGLMHKVPMIHAVVISFNGGTKESYEYTTGLDFDEVVKNIRKHYPDLAKVYAELHCLIWEGNNGSQGALKALWSDFPGKVRLSYKYDNQMRSDKTVEGYKRTNRIYCDYLDMLSVMPDGRIISCAHDFDQVTDFGNAFTDSWEMIWNNTNRLEKQREHRAETWTGLCKKCNYNTEVDTRIVYLK